MRQPIPVTNWARDFDYLDPRWTQDPYPIWSELRTACPIAHTSRFGGVYLPTREADVRAIAYDTDHFSSRTVVIREQLLDVDASAPPLTADPPHHREPRKILMSAFRPEVIRGLDREIEGLAAERLAGVAAAAACEAAGAYSTPLALAAIVRFLGLPDKDSGLVRGWVVDVLGEGLADGGVASRALADLSAYVSRQIARRRYRPGPGALGHLLEYRSDDRPLPDSHIVTSIRLLLMAGFETSASALGASLWHLAQHEDHRRKLVAEPALIPAAVEELLRLYAPVSIAREVVGGVEVGGTRFEPGQKVLLCYPAANRDPAAFPDPDRFDIGRQPNRHLTFGAGIHRCIGADLARSIVRIGIQQWLARIPEFRLDPAATVDWSPGVVRGPRRLDLMIGQT